MKVTDGGSEVGLSWGRNTVEKRHVSSWKDAVRRWSRVFRDRHLLIPNNSTSPRSQRPKAPLTNAICYCHYDVMQVIKLII